MLFEYSFSSTEIELLLDIIFSEVIPEVLKSVLPKYVPRNVKGMVGREFYNARSLYQERCRDEFRQKALELYNIDLNH